MTRLADQVVRLARHDERCTCGARAELVLAGQPVCITLADIDQLHARVVGRRELSDDTGDAGGK